MFYTDSLIEQETEKGGRHRENGREGENGALRAQIFLAGQLLPPGPAADLPGYH